MTQPTYGQVPNGQPQPQYPASPTPEQYPPQAYPQAQNYQPNPAVQQYPQAPTYPGNPGGYPTEPYAEPPRKSPVLGIVALVIVLVCAIIFFVSSLNLYNTFFAALGPGLLNSGMADIATMTSQLDSMTDAQLTAISAATIGIIISSVFGIVGFILSIVATAKNKGRPFGIIGIILGIIAPLSLLLAAGIAAASYM